MTQEEMKASQRLYARKLTEFPADIALEATRAQSNRSQWWPAWAELYEEMAPATAERRLRLKALYELRDAPPEAKAVVEQPLSQGQRTAIVASARARWAPPSDPTGDGKPSKPARPRGSGRVHRAAQKLCDEQRAAFMGEGAGEAVQ